MSCARLATLLKTPAPVVRPTIARPQRKTTIVKSNQILPQNTILSFHTSKILRNENKTEEKTTQQTENKEAPKEQTQQTQPDNRDATIKQLESQVEDYKKQLLYTMAERENIRRVAASDVEKAKEYGLQSFAKHLLDVADNLTRCVQACPPEGYTDKNAQLLLDAVQMTEKEFYKVLEKNHITKFNPVGQKFDPNTMNALMQVPIKDKEPNTVAAVFKPGFMLKDRVLRAAEVSVVVKYD